MNVLILAAGRGSRLKSNTDNKPKCLNTIKGFSLLDWQLTVLRKKFKNIFLVRGYLGEKFTKQNVKYIDNSFWKTSNMVNSFFISVNSIMNHKTLITYSDIIYGPEIIEKILETNDDITITYDTQWFDLWNERFDNPLKDAESFMVDNNGYLTEIGEKNTNYSKIQGQFMGLMMFSKEAIKYLYDLLLSFDKKKLFELDMTSFFQILLRQGIKIRAIPVSGNWMEIDKPNDLIIAEKMIKEGRLELVFPEK